MRSVISEVEICGHAIFFSRIRSSIAGPCLVSAATIVAPEKFMFPLVRAGAPLAGSSWQTLHFFATKTRAPALPLPSFDIIRRDQMYAAIDRIWSGSRAGVFGLISTP